MAKLLKHMLSTVSEHPQLQSQENGIMTMHTWVMEAAGTPLPPPPRQKLEGAAGPEVASILVPVFMTLRLSFSVSSENFHFPCMCYSRL